VRNTIKGLLPGQVILLHDGGGDRSQTVAALPQILAAALRRG
jgi:peptidoglycan-N-acetylglucosamine deacetylase